VLLKGVHSWLNRRPETAPGTSTSSRPSSAGRRFRPCLEGLEDRLVPSLSAVGLIGPAAGMGAVAGIQDDRLNTATLGQVEPRLDLIQQTGARVTRVDMFWSEIAPAKPADPDDPFDPAYQFAKFDAIFSGLAARRITPIVTVYSAPSWATAGPEPRAIARAISGPPKRAQPAA